MGDDRDTRLPANWLSVSQKPLTRNSGRIGLACDLATGRKRIPISCWNCSSLRI